MSELEIHLLAVVILAGILACWALFHWFRISLGVLVLRAITFGNYRPNLGTTRDEFFAEIMGTAAIVGGCLAALHLL